MLIAKIITIFLSFLFGMSTLTKLIRRQTISVGMFVVTAIAFTALVVLFLLI